MVNKFSKNTSMVKNSGVEVFKTDVTFLPSTKEEVWLSLWGSESCMSDGDADSVAIFFNRTTKSHGSFPNTFLISHRRGNNIHNRRGILNHEDWLQSVSKSRWDRAFFLDQLPCMTEDQPSPEKQPQSRMDVWWNLRPRLPCLPISFSYKINSHVFFSREKPASLKERS